MAWYWSIVVGVLAALAGAGVSFLAARRLRRRKRADGRKLIRPLIEDHCRPARTDDLTISGRRFPFRVRADLQRAIDRLCAADSAIPALPELELRREEWSQRTKVLQRAAELIVRVRHEVADVASSLWRAAQA